MKLTAALFILMSITTAGLSCALAMPIAGKSLESDTSNITRVWDNCGHGRYRTPSGVCVSNWRPGPNGCPVGYHLGWDVRMCMRNR